MDRPAARSCGAHRRFSEPANEKAGQQLGREVMHTQQRYLGEAAWRAQE
jgi:hypothetical protein